MASEVKNSAPKKIGQESAEFKRKRLRCHSNEKSIHLLPGLRVAP